MLKKVAKNNSLISEEDLVIKKGTVSGISIKPIKTTEKKIRIDNIFSKSKVIKKWGFFLYINMEDGYEYEAVWKMQKTYSINELTNFRNVPVLVPKKKKQRIDPLIVIQYIFNIFGIDDLYKLIGTEINILESKVSDKHNPNKDGFGICSKDSFDYLYPDYFSIEKIKPTKEEMKI